MLDLNIDRDSRIPVYHQISQSIRDLILRQKLPEGFRLPPERTLARSLGVNRTTVLNAYRELKSEGLIGGRVGAGTTVLGGRAERAPLAAEVQPLRWADLARPIAAQPVELRELMALSERDDVILLSTGFPALELTPVELLRATSEAVLAERGAAALFYAPTEGVTSFREALCDLMEARGAHCRPEQILVTSGSQQALDLVTRVLVEPGDVVLVEEPTYFGALQVFRAAHARVLPVPTDDEGMRTDVLAELLARHKPKLLYTLPTFQNPSGRVMSMERRLELLDLAYRFRVPLLEDDVYPDLSYEGPVPPSLLSLDRSGFVIHVSSFSKVLCPGLRVGWIAGPRTLVRTLVQAKQSADLQAPTLGQMLFERLVRTGGYARHAAAVREAYARRLSAMDRALRRHASDWASFSRPRGGSYVWVRLERSVSPTLLAARAAAEGVSYLPGSLCFAEDRGRDYLRLSFSFASPRDIDEGLARLSRAVRAALRGTPERHAPVSRPVL